MLEVINDVLRLVLCDNLRDSVVSVLGFLFYKVGVESKSGFVDLSGYGSGIVL